MSEKKPALYTCLSPALLHLYDVSESIVVIIDVLRATSTIATALHNGATCIIPVDSVPECIKIGTALNAITAGERDGKVAEGLQYANSPFEYPKSFIENKTLVLTTTNGTKLLHQALAQNAKEIITGSFPNFSAVCEFLVAQKLPVVLGCAAWKDKVNLEDTLFAGAVIESIKEHFDIACDASKMALLLHQQAGEQRYEFMETQQASHFLRLQNFGLEKDLRYCLSKDGAPVLPIYKEAKLISYKGN